MNGKLQEELAKAFLFYVYEGGSEAYKLGFAKTQSYVTAKMAELERAIHENDIRRRYVGLDVDVIDCA